MTIDLAPHWATVADILHDGLMVVDPKGVIQAVNQSAEKLTGYPKDELLGRSCRVLDCTGCKISPSGPEGPHCGLFAAGQVGSKRCTITRRDGTPVTVLKRASVLHDETGAVIGAVETLTDLSELVGKEQELHALRQGLRQKDSFHGMIGATPVMRRLFSLIETVAPSPAPVLILGPSGVGKEMVARAIHELGPRRQGPYVRVNCAALNQNLLESELFGHVKGSFTGADRDRMGRFGAAQGGDLLLDEIGDLPLPLQVKLLRVLEEKEMERVGDYQPIALDVRILAATNQPLEELVRQGRFRQDLFYRLEGVPIQVPALSQRREDIPLLVQHFLQSAAAKNAKHLEGLTPPALAALMDYPWPGNVRELKNAVEYAAVLCPQGWVGPDHLPPKINITPPAPELVVELGPSADLDMCEELLQALRQAKGNQTQAAKLLGISRVTVWNRINRCGIDLKRDI